MKRTADVIVIGLGAVGAATLYQLARRGVRAVGIDRFRPPHDRGSSHGETRITRLGIGEGEVYVPLALRSHEIWRELEAATGARLLLQCGFAAIDASEGTSRMHGKAGFAARTVAAARRFGIAHEVLTGDELMRRHPGFVLRGDEHCYFEPEGGLVYPERCIAAQLAEAERLGARKIVNEPVLEIVNDGAGVSVRTARETLGAARAVLAAGGWSPGLAGGALSGMRLLRQVLHWFEPEDPGRFGHERFPTFIWTHGPRPEDSFYGFPLAPGATCGVKLATEQYSAEITAPEQLDRAVRPEERRAMLAEHARGRLAPLGRALQSAVCFYTAAADGDFAIGPLPDRPQVIAASACSGHGFKHSAGLGERLAELVVDGRAIDAEFALARPALSA
ncbi:MAG: N-methyl-L-tryptophan oxidase [Sphingomonadaceae bacterium]|nr:N-methyl-L-tryptophan oxidase [Sphingomonadaceae bacterium]